MREDEANFIGYLACISSENEAFRYSGYLTGWVYAGNALARVDRKRYIELTDQLCEGARQDLDENSDFWNRYESRVSEAATRMNDTYLKNELPGRRREKLRKDGGPDVILPKNTAAIS